MGKCKRDGCTNHSTNGQLMSTINRSYDTITNWETKIVISRSIIMFQEIFVIDKITRCSKILPIISVILVRKWEIK